MFRRSQLQWTVVGIWCSIAAATCYYASAILVPKALVDQGAALSLSFGLSSLLFMASIPSKFFTGFIMEIIGRRWAIFYAFGGALPGLRLMMFAHRAGPFATVVMSTGALITGFTVLSSLPAVRVYLPRSSRRYCARGQYFGEACGRVLAGALAPFLLTPYTGSPTIFFGTLAVVALIGAFVPVVFAKETVGLLETVTEGAPDLA